MIIYLRSSLINEDVRLRKYIESCEKEGIKHLALTWDRESSGIYSKVERPFKQRAQYGRRWKNLLKKIKWQFFLIKKLIKYRSQVKTIHACDFDTMLPALIFKSLFNVKVIYDVYDAFSVVKPTSFIQFIIRKIDLYFLKNANLIILADQARIVQMGIEDLINKVFIVENVPSIVNLNISSNLNPLIVESETLSLAYVGVLDSYRGIEDILEIVDENTNMTINIAGLGILNDLVKKYAEKNPRIKYWGFVDYNTGLEIMSKSDIIVGLYYPVIPNHIYAAPNKYFEALFLSKPLLTSSDTLVGDKVNEYGTGYVVASNKNDILYTLRNIDTSSNEYINIVNNAKKLWISKYETYQNSYLRTLYVEKLK